jgi:PilZ domain
MTYPRCPQCSTKYVKRVHRESLKERLLSVFYIYPFRCQLCGHRFNFHQPGIKYVRVEEDRRIYERFPINFPVTFTSSEVDGEGSVADISMAGCTIESGAKLERGLVLRMSLPILDVMPPIEAHAAIVRNVQQSRRGVEFLQLQKTEKDRLREFIVSLLVAQETGERAGS